MRHLNYHEKTHKGLVFAIDLGGTNLRGGLVDENGRIHFRFKQNTPRRGNQNEIVRTIVEAVLSSKQQDDGLNTSAISVAVPGTVDVEMGTVLKAPNVPCLDGFRLAAALESELKLPTILENDANAAAIGEAWQGAAKGLNSIVCMTLGTGVGGGIILDNRLLAWRML